MASETQALLDRLNPVCRRALELSAGLCVRRRNPSIEVEHLLRALLDLPQIDCQILLTEHGLDTRTLEVELNCALDLLPEGHRDTPSFSAPLRGLLARAWRLAARQSRDAEVRSAHLLLAALGDPQTHSGMVASCPSLLRLPREISPADLVRILAHSAEGEFVPASQRRAPEAEVDAEDPSVGDAESTASGSRATEAQASMLDRYTVDLVREAREGRLDPVCERADEIRQVIDILTRRRQNNPILVGDAGVGKTAIAEGLALKVAVGDVPEPLRDLSLRVLDLGLLEAGASLKGEFEKRLGDLVAEVQAAGPRVVLFIDEAHNLIGAGGSEGRGDAANLLKPALAAGTLRTVAATTWPEYKRYFESDSALARRFQLVKVDEPDAETAISMLRGVVPTLEEHHAIMIRDDAVVEAVRLSQRFIPDRKLPAKAISVLDTAAARVALAQHGRPPSIESLSQSIRRISREVDSLEHDVPISEAHVERLEVLAAERRELESRRSVLEDRWHAEGEIVASIRALRAQLESDSTPHGTPRSSRHDEATARLLELETELERIQGRTPLVPLCCDGRVVAEVVSVSTGIPIGRVLRDEVEILLSLQDRLAERIVGQDEALGRIARRVHTARAGLEDPGKPKGVFLLVGPTGVGKTAAAIALADLLFGNDKNLITLNMSEFQEPHSVATLKGAPPGYVGYGKGGVLTEAVRRNPYCVVLLDEVEKAHGEVLELFYQVFDRGSMEDGEGVRVDFKHSVILMTSNIGGDAILDACKSSNGRPDADRLIEDILPELRRHFAGPLLGRLEVVPFYPLVPEALDRIVELKLEAIRERILETYGAELTFDDRLVQVISKSSRDAETGARRIDSILNQSLLPELSGRILRRIANGETFEKIHISVDENGQFV